MAGNRPEVENLIDQENLLEYFLMGLRVGGNVGTETNAIDIVTINCQ